MLQGHINQPAFSLEVIILKMVNNAIFVYLQPESTTEKLILPSTHINVSVDKNVDAAVRRCVFERLSCDASYIEQVKTIGNATRYPQKWMVTSIYFALVFESREPQQDAWYPVSTLSQYSLAYDHLGVINSCLKRLRNKTQYTSMPLHLMPNEFTMTELQLAYECLLDTFLDKKSFRRRMLESGLLLPLARTRRGQNRPAQLYQVKLGHIIHHFSRNMHGSVKEEV